MSLAENAVAQYRDVIDRERQGQGHDYQKWRARYVELMLSGEDSPDSRREMTDILFFLEAPEDGSPPLTPDDMLADAQAIQKARTLMGLAADHREGSQEFAEGRKALYAIKRLAEFAPRHAERVLADAEMYTKSCRDAAPELHRLATQHPHLFEVGADGTPKLIGADIEELGRHAREARRVDSIYQRMKRCEDALDEVADSLGKVPDDHQYRRFFLLWQAERQREHEELAAELAAVADVDSYKDWKSRQPTRWLPLSGRTVRVDEPAPDQSPTDTQPADAAGGEDAAANDTEDHGSPEYANNEGQAMAALGLSDAEWQLLRKDDSFPNRTSRGWDLVAIRLWLEVAADDETAPDAAKDPAAGDAAAAA